MVLGLFLFWIWLFAISDAAGLSPSWPIYSNDLYEAMVIEIIFTISVPLVALGFFLRHRTKRLSQVLVIVGLLVMVGFFIFGAP